LERKNNMLKTGLEKPIENLEKYFQDKFGNVKFEELNDEDKKEYLRIKEILDKTRFLR